MHAMKFTTQLGHETPRLGIIQKDMLSFLRKDIL